MKKSIDPFWLVAGLVLVVWVYCFRVFLFREAPLISDAVSFYDHLKFYIDNIILGVYPLWDPLWSSGSPNELFLRRIGPFNPLLLLIAIPYKLGLSFWASFAAFITFYYFLGMFGFYKIALEVLKDKKAALLAFALLSLSSLGTRVFDSYIMMFMTPTIWFFYFLLVFGRSMQKYALAGMVFCVMLLMTTYIPFYFIVIALTFGLFFIPIFPTESKNFLFRFLGFIRQNLLFSALCLMALVVSCIPGYMFFKHAGEGTFAMPLRHFNAAAANELSVKSDVTTYWAIPEDLLFSLFYLEDLRFFDFAVFYIPVICILFLLIGLATSLNRKMVFMFVWGFFLLLMGSPYWLPLYDFLHQYVFFFKYFRNLHFFLWLVILPLFILFVVEQVRVYCHALNTQRTIKKRSLFFIVVVHGGLAAFLFWQGSCNYSTWIVIGASLVLFLLLCYRRITLTLFYTLCLVTVMIEPIEAYYHLSRNVLKYVALSVYEQFTPEFQYTRGKKTVLLIDPKDMPEQSEGGSDPLYFGTQWYNSLWDNVDFMTLKNATFTKFVVYDHVAVLDEKKQGLKIIEQTWKNKMTVAYIAPEPAANSLLKEFGGPVGGLAPLAIEQENSEFRVVRSNSNSVKVETGFPVDKFLVFNDGYYPGWSAFLNSKPIPLYRANVAFKGVWVPAGKQTIEFRFGKPQRYALELGILLFYYAFFFGFLWLWRRAPNDQ